MKSLTLFVLIALAVTCRAEVKLSKVFTPHMVLQRGMAVPIWGTATAGESVTVKFREQSKSATADADGKWSVKLDALKPGEAAVLTVGDKTVDDVVVGDVWIGSGQSNMDMPVSLYTANDPVLDAASKQAHPKLRLMRKEANATWELSTPETNVKMSALLFAFGIALEKEVDVPIGLMVGAVGGTPSGFWLSEDMYRGDAACAAVVKEFAKTYNFDAEMGKFIDAQKKYLADLAAWKVKEAEAKAAGQKAPPGPRGPQKPVIAGEAGSGKIGQLFEAYIRPYVGYAIKGVLWDQGESRTNIVGVDQVTLMGALIGGWRKAWGQGEFPWLYVEKPSGGGPAFDYSNPMNSKADKFEPLPKVQPMPPDAEYSHEVFTRIMKYPNTHMVTSSDLGAGTHPVSKSAYGARAVQVATAIAYQKSNEYLGPMHAAHEVTGDKLKIKFTHTGKGLVFKNGDKLQGFAVAGADKKFVWADAVIEGDTVVLSSKDVPAPVAARFAWSPTFHWANLFNTDGFPAQPFRTDSW